MLVASAGQDHRHLSEGRGKPRRAFRACAPFGVLARLYSSHIHGWSTDMTAPQRRRRRSTRRTLNGISLTVIGLCAVIIIVVNLAGSHSTKQSPSSAKVTPAATGGSASVAASVRPENTPRPTANKKPSSRAAKTVAQPTSQPAPVATSASCYPLSNEGRCYEPGEYCRDSDHGVTGVAGDGEQITCEDNDGWRWEPA
jgi:hypothetical protein